MGEKVDPFLEYSFGKRVITHLGCKYQISTHLIVLCTFIAELFCSRDFFTHSSYRISQVIYSQPLYSTFIFINLINEIKLLSEQFNKYVSKKLESQWWLDLIKTGH